MDETPLSYQCVTQLACANSEVIGRCSEVSGSTWEPAPDGTGTWVPIPCGCECHKKDE